MTLIPWSTKMRRRQPLCSMTLTSSNSATASGLVCMCYSLDWQRRLFGPMGFSQAKEYSSEFTMPFSRDLPHQELNRVSVFCIAGGNSLPTGHQGLLLAAWVCGACQFPLAAGDPRGLRKPGKTFKNNNIFRERGEAGTELGSCCELALILDS